jgi:hypothetical protein
MFWWSFRLVPVTEIESEREELQTKDFWFGGLEFRIAATGELLPHAFPAGRVAETIRENGQVWMRGLYTESTIANGPQSESNEPPKPSWIKWLWLRATGR